MTDPTPITEADSLVIPWPTVRPMGFRLSAAGLQQAWSEIMTPIAEEQIPQSIELRCLMAALRAVFDGMHGIVTTMEHEPLSRVEFYLELNGLMNSLDDHVTADMAADQLRLLAERLVTTAPETWEGTEE